MNDPEWWGRILDADVVAVELTEDRLAGGATSVIERAKVRVRRAGGEETLPLLVKRSVDAFRGLDVAAPPQWRVERDFYLHCAGRLPVQTPRCWYAESSEDGTQGTLVLADVRPVRMWLDPLGPDDLDRALVVAARMHAATWAPAHDLAWAPRGPLLLVDALPRLWPSLRTSVEPAHRPLYDLVVSALPRLADRAARRPGCLVHGDLSPRNLLPTPDGDLCLIDFGSAIVGPGAIDASRLAAACLPVAGDPSAQRAACELWHATLVAHGVVDYTPEDAWADWRLGLALNAQFGILESSAPWSDPVRAESYRRGAEGMHRALVACDVAGLAESA